MERPKKIPARQKGLQNGRSWRKKILMEEYLRQTRRRIEGVVFSSDMG